MHTRATMARCSAGSRAMAAATACSVSSLSATTRPSGPAMPLHGVDIHHLAPDFVGPEPVQPDVLRDPVHPGIEPGSGLPEVDPRQGAQAGVLNQVVSLLGAAGEGIREPP